MRWTRDTQSWATRQRQQLMRAQALYQLLSAFGVLNYTVVGVEDTPKQVKFVLGELEGDSGNLIRVLKLGQVGAEWRRRVLKPVVHNLHLTSQKARGKTLWVLTVTF